MTDSSDKFDLFKRFSFINICDTLHLDDINILNRSVLEDEDVFDDLNRGELLEIECLVFIHPKLPRQAVMYPKSFLAF